MGSTITHKDAALLASSVYEIQNDRFTPPTIDRFKNQWDLSNHDDVVGGSSGTLWIIKKRTGFGIVATGRGEFKHDALILLRGTDNNFDWATDATVGFSSSETGRFVHTGFNKCFDTILPELKERVLSLGQNIRTIHCVGHSLGGALATLTSEWLKKAGISPTDDVKLYTFGSPRVGALSFVKLMTSELDNGKNIYRVFHKTDVVPMVPMWPFYHLPYGEKAYCLNSPGNSPSGEYHKMGRYIESVNKASSWDTMYELEPEIPTSAIEQWLSSEGPVSFTINTMNMINKAISYVILKILKLTGISIQLGLASGVTLLDMLAYILQQGIDFSKSLSSWVYYLVKKIMIALGMKIKEDISLTYQFIRHILTTLKQKIDLLVEKAARSIFGN
ncbi:lipase family protein [Microbulbifer sp. OS29]|uniref:Lipase family protein n=1 Tax=Microbulbifer okhotskensis TaxID=2926617 RepID=A0A9X2J4U6_9GAMM|nr:lipase family protein [Microbulbifer okhotskensis]MCO1332925.1 lipase family protein [Microbulbifer okhotskensis]